MRRLYTLESFSVELIANVTSFNIECKNCFVLYYKTIFVLDSLLIVQNNSASSKINGKSTNGLKIYVHIIIICIKNT